MITTFRLLLLPKKKVKRFLLLFKRRKAFRYSKIEGAVVSERTSYNVTAAKPSTFKKKGTNDIIVVGAHHDSVAGAPGANDDASGTAMVLELARVFKTLPTDTELRFVTFGAEEVGLLGSEHYVSELSENEKNRIVGMFNLDMVGSRDAGDLVMNTADGTPNLVTELAQASSTRLNGSPTPFQAGGRSDHVPLQRQEYRLLYLFTVRLNLGIIP